MPEGRRARALVRTLRHCAVLAGALVPVVVPAAASAELTTTTSSSDLVGALAPGNLVTGSSWVDIGADTGAAPASSQVAGVFAGFGPVGFPADGGSFASLTTGDATLINRTSNSSSSAGASTSATARSANDVSVLKVDINVPASANCLTMNLAFLSEEFPEYVGSSFNDAALVELDANNWSVTGNTVTAPANFAFDDEGDPLTVNSANFRADTPTGTEYDGSTVKLTAATQVTPGAHSLYFSIFDLGDRAYDSALLIDNLRARDLPAADCVSGAKITDKDGDGLPDDWETDGYDHDGDGTVDVDLPAMGADPNHKDLFVEMDAMPNLRLGAAALKDAVDAMADAPLSNPDGTTGVTLHVDNGSGSLMNPKTGGTWGALSKATNFPYDAQLGDIVGDTYQWQEFQAIKDDYFSAARVPVFRYAVSVNRIDQQTYSGIARGIPGSDFIVSLGGHCAVEGQCAGTKSKQTGTFLHELGHTLGLKHGGNDDINNKPNYLSVMNYTFQFPGLDGPKRWDYSRFGEDKIYPLFEGGISEPNGFGPLNTDDAAAYRTVIYCAPPLLGLPATRFVRRSIDFDCDGGATNTNVSTDLNSDGNFDQVLRPFDDWAAVKLQGGAIGGLGLDVLLPDTTEADEAPLERLVQTQAALVDPPVVTAGEVTDITTSSAKVNAGFTTKADARVSFRYGPDGETLTEQTPEQPVTGSGAASATLSGLQTGRRYRARPVIVTDDHEIIGSDMVFTVSAQGADVPAPPQPPGPIVPGVGPITPAAKKPKKVKKANACAKVTTKKQRKACFTVKKASCAKQRGAKRKACLTRAVTQTCALATRYTKKARRAKARRTCVAELRSSAGLKRRP